MIASKRNDDARHSAVGRGDTDFADFTTYPKGCAPPAECGGWSPGRGMLAEGCVEPGSQPSR